MRSLGSLCRRRHGPGGAIAGVTTVGGVVTVIQGEGKIGELSDRSQQWLVGFLIVALCLAVFAIVTAFSVGWEKATQNSGSRLNWSITATIFSLMLLVGSAFIPWKGGEPAAPQQYLIRYSDNTVVCGPLEWAVLSDVVEIMEASACPTTG